MGQYKVTRLDDDPLSDVYWDRLELARRLPSDIPRVKIAVKVFGPGGGGVKLPVDEVIRRLAGLLAEATDNSWWEEDR
jgi:hypothetical protein